MNDGPNILNAILGAGGVMTLLWLVFVVFMFLLPFFVLKIRNEVVGMNRRLDTIITLLGGKVPGKTAEAAGKGYKYCPMCKARNRLEDYTCLSCGASL